MSQQHVVIRFVETWELLVLETTNGTQLNGTPLVPSRYPVDLAVGDRIWLGCDDHQWDVFDVSPPGPAAVGESGCLVARDGILHFPGSDHRLSAHGEGWVLVGDRNREHAVWDSMEVLVADQLWRLLLPANRRGGSSATVPNDHQAIAVHLVVHEEADGPIVESYAVVTGGVRWDLECGAHTRLVLELAELSEVSRRSGHDEAMRGWVLADELIGSFKITEAAFNNWLYRSRKQVRDVGAQGASEFIEARATSGGRQLRLASSHCTIHYRVT